MIFASNVPTFHLLTRRFRRLSADDSRNAPCGVTYRWHLISSVDYSALSLPAFLNSAERNSAITIAVDRSAARWCTVEFSMVRDRRWRRTLRIFHRLSSPAAFIAAPPIAMHRDVRFISHCRKQLYRYILMLMYRVINTDPDDYFFFFFFFFCVANLGKALCSILHRAMENVGNILSRIWNCNSDIMFRIWNRMAVLSVDYGIV